MNNLLFGASMTSLRRMMLIAGMGVNETEYTVTGNPVSFKTNVAKPLTGITVPFSPIQNLNGQSNPYPAGGGKNLVPMTVENLKSLNTSQTWSGDTYTLNGVTFAIIKDSEENVFGIKVTGTATSNTFFYLGAKNNGLAFTESTSYILSGCPSGSVDNNYRLQVTDGVTSTYSDTGSGRSFTPDSTFVGNSYYTAIRIASGYACPTAGLEFKPMIRLSSVTDGTFAPYSNICPIYGYTQGNLYRTGVNVWDEEWKLGSFNTKGEYVTGYNFICPKNPVRVIPGATYYFSKSVLVWQYDAYMNHIVATTAVPGTGLKTMQPNTHYINFRTTEELTTYGNDISINYPSTDTEYHAYSGNTYLLFGANIWDEEVELGGINSSTGLGYSSKTAIRAKNYIPVVPGASYYLKAPSMTGFTGCWYDADKNRISTRYAVNQVMTAPDNAYFFRFGLPSSYGTTYNNDISINYPSSITEHEPYVGTIYGGSLDVNTGVLTVDKGIVDLGSLTWLTAGSGRHYTAKQQDMAVVDNSKKMNAICSMYTVDNGNAFGIHDYIIGMVNSSNIMIADSSLDGTDNATFKTAMSGVQLVYELATPLTYQLTPQQITALLGDNTIWTDTNGNNEIKYLKKG